MNYVFSKINRKIFINWSRLSKCSYFLIYKMELYIFLPVVLSYSVSLLRFVSDHVVLKQLQFGMPYYKITYRQLILVKLNTIWNWEYKQKTGDGR